MKFEFWSSPSSWPADPVGYVFLARAIGMVGRAMYPDEWTGAEVMAPVLTLLPRFEHLGLHRNDRTRAHDLLRRHRPEIAEVTQTSAYSLGLHGPTLSAEQWRVAAELSEAEVARVLPARARMDAVKAEIVRRSEAGDLLTYSRPVKGGNVQDLPLSAWRTESLAPRFYQCQINPRDPFGTGIGGEHYCYIFVGKVSLDQALASLSGLAVDPAAAWLPLPEQTLKDWCVMDSPETEARLRVKMAVTSNPSGRDICKALARMWQLADRGPANWKTIEQYRVAANRGAQNR
jgi:hypothetical protein